MAFRSFVRRRQGGKCGRVFADREIDGIDVRIGCEGSRCVGLLTAPMKEELNAIDTESLKARLSELRRYL